MSEALGLNKGKNKIKYKKNVLAMTDFVQNSGSAVIGQDEIQLYPNSSVTCTYNPAKLKEKALQYIKFVITPVDSTGTLSTDNAHNLSVVIKIRYEDSDENNKRTTICYFPRYLHEYNFSGNIVFDSPSETVKSIGITIYNNENQIVKLRNIKLRYSVVVSDNALTSAIESVNTEDGSIISESGVSIDGGSIVYLVPAMTLAQWNDLDKTKCNEAIIVG